MEVKKKKTYFSLKLHELSFHVFQDEENQQEEEAEEIASEEEVDRVTRPSLNQEVVMEEEVEEDKDERAVEMEEMLETSEEEPDDGEADTGMSKWREEEVEDEEETMEIIPDPQDEKVQRASPVQEEGEGMGEDEALQNTNQTNDGVVTEIQDQVLEEEQEEQEDSNQNLEDKREGDEEESGELLEQEEEEEEEKEEEEEETKEPTQDDQTGEEQESDETMSHLDIKQLKHDPAEESTPPPLSLPEPQSNTDSDEVLLSASCESTNLQISLVSPSSEDLPSLSQLPPAVADYGKNVPETPPGGESSAEEEQAEAAKDEEQKESQQEPNASVTHPADLSKVRFTITPARQRPQSSTGLITLSSPVSGPGGVEAEQETKVEPASLAERVTEGRNPVSPVVKPAQTSAAARRAGEDTNISCLVRGGKASKWKQLLTCCSNFGRM